MRVLEMRGTTRLLIRSAVAFLILVSSVLALALQAKAGPYSIDVTTSSGRIEKGNADLLVKVTLNGQPVAGAEVRAIAAMPGMYMGEREMLGIPTQDPGVYTVKAVFPMEGDYEIKVTVDGPQGRGVGTVATSTGAETGGAGGGFPWSTVVLVVVGLLLAALVIRQMRRTGQSVDPRPILNRQVILSLAVLGAALAVAMWVVQNNRRQGAMTPIEAQVMDMSAPAPEGSTTVVLATVREEAFGATAEYTGQAVGFVEQDVVPRVTGTIQSMPFYVGDRVKKGQLLARLDTSQLDPQVAERVAQSQAASQGIGVAALEHQQMLAMISEAQAELSMAQSGLEEARANLTATEASKPQAEAEVQSAEADLQAMEAEVTSAEAEAKYMSDQLARAKQLRDAGAISAAEFQMEQTEAQKAQSMLRRAQEGVRKSRSMVASARAMVRKADAEISAMRKKVNMAQAQVRAAEAGVRTARTAAMKARQMVGQARSEANMARAGLQGAAAQRSYAELRAEVDGVITQRLISPGVLVSPSQAVLKVAQVSPIRLQANVPESVLSTIREGAIARITRRGRSEEPIVARVTSVSPAVDPSSRLGVVEVLWPNKEGRFQPGQFVSMKIDVGSRRSAPVIPDGAVRREVDPGSGVISRESRTFVWLAEPIPNQPGNYTVSRKEVTIGESSEGQVAVQDGLEPGQQVVVQGGQFLRAGQMVAAADATPAASGDSHTIKVSAKGYSPAQVRIPAGKPVTLTFLRVEEQGCGDHIVFPALKIDKPLPVNQPVKVEIPPRKEGVLRFTCGMDMYDGKVVVR